MNAWVAIGSGQAISWLVCSPSGAAAWQKSGMLTALYKLDITNVWCDAGLVTLAALRQRGAASGRAGAPPGLRRTRRCSSCLQTLLCAVLTLHAPHVRSCGGGSLGINKCRQTGNWDGQSRAVKALIMLCKHMPHTALLCYQLIRNPGTHHFRQRGAPCNGLALGQGCYRGVRRQVRASPVRGASCARMLWLNPTHSGSGSLSTV